MEYKLINMCVDKFEYKKNNISINKCEVFPIMKKNIKKLNEELYEVKLMFLIESTEEKNVPYDIELILSGNFHLKDFTDEELESFLYINAVQILFPYLRSILSTAMTSLMVQPIFIPLLDARSISN